jgi:hypothetical protein
MLAGWRLDREEGDLARITQGDPQGLQYVGWLAEKSEATAWHRLGFLRDGAIQGFQWLPAGVKIQPFETTSLAALEGVSADE